MAEGAVVALLRRSLDLNYGLDEAEASAGASRLISPGAPVEFRISHQKLFGCFLDVTHDALDQLYEELGFASAVAP